MSFGGGGGFGGFGQNNNQSSGGFGGFGASNTNNNTASPSAFGSGNTGGFGQNNSSTGGGMFGGNNNTAGSSFGASTGGFGANNNAGGGFGAKPAFGAANTGNTGGGLFGASSTTNTPASTFGGFGNTTNNTTSSPFGGGNTTGSGLFGNNNAAKPGFGATGNTGSSLFGGGAAATTNTAGGFGSGGFGAANNPGLGAVGDPPGTAVAPFQAYKEKEPNSANATNSFENIIFQDPYKKWSAEELRLADYTQGRRHGNASGGGAFGVSSGFGGGGFGQNNQSTTGFGNNATANTGGGLFGGNNAASTTNNATSSPFGQAATTGGFGANANNNASGGLFANANKPAGSLFGSTPAQPQQGGGGLFGSSTSGGFGAANNNAASNSFSSNTGGGLFGANAQKPAQSGGLFNNAGSSSTPSLFGGASNNAFGSTNNNTSGGSGLFGAANNNNAPAAGGGLFGNNNNQQQQPQQQQQSSGLFGGGGFGQNQAQNQTQQTGSSLFNNNNQQKPGGLFVQTPANANSGGLFANANNQQQSQGGFGASNNASASGGLFGAKPATGGGGLFGNSQPQNNNAGGGGLFGGLGGNQQNQQSGGSGGLFGSTNNQQQKPSLFGSTNQGQGGGMFQNSQNQGSSLFGGSMNQQQQQNNGLGSSLLGNSQQGSNTPQGLTANLNDVSAYGSSSLFSNLGGNETPNPGPLAVPLNSTPKPRRGSLLPLYKLAPASASRKQFGFSYSNFGTPGGSPASSISSTPGGIGRSLLGASSSGSLSKSMSTNNLRRSFNTEDSILAPGAFSSSSSSRWYGSTGSKKLIINRDIRSDLFSTPQKDKEPIDSNTSSRKLSKRVSFDTSNVEAENETPIRGALPAPEDVPASQAEDTPRQSRSSNGSNGPTPETSSAKSKDLAIVHEEDGSMTPDVQDVSGFDNAPGEYYMDPPKEELQEMNRMQRQRVDQFRVGRENVGSITFKVPVDLSAIDLDDLCGTIIQLEPRSATVYPITAKKPPVGKGLNVPARIALEQSWPRGREKRNLSDPKRYKKHIERLTRMPDTTFEDYDRDTGIWVFSVEHFTTYGLEDSDDDSDLEIETEQPIVSPRFSESQQLAMETSVNSSMEDDTFHFRQGRVLPGAFDEPEQPFEEDDFTSKQSFLGVSSADSAPNDVRLLLEEQYTDDMGEEYDLSDDEDMARSSSGQHLAAELDDASSEGGQDAKKGTPGGILRARMRAMKDSAGPVRLEVADGDDWMEMLRKTVSPSKRDRQLLRELNGSPSKESGLLINLDKSEEEDVQKTSIWKKSAAKASRVDAYAAGTQLSMDKGRGFATSIDLMNSLFEKPKPVAQNLRASVPSKGFPKWPYERQEKTLTIDESERAFHDASRPTWGPNETLVVTRSLEATHARRTLRDNSDILNFQRSSIQTNQQDLRMAKFSTESSKKFLRTQDRLTEIRVVDGIPMAKLHAPSMKDVFHHQDMSDPASIHEKRVWELASILFDDIPESDKPNYQVRRELLSQFWTDLVDQASSKTIGLAGSSEEKAVACLAGHRVIEACKHLLDGKNFHLGTLVPLIGTSDAAKKDMREQLKAWHDSKMLSEFSEAIRTIYELLGGNVCVCEGMKGVPVEDRMESFVISKKFGLDWKQSFGLRLWYAIPRQDDVAAAVKKYKADIAQDKEELPRPWYAEQGILPLWNDTNAGSRQDLLWGLLQLYADQQVDLEAVLRPENSQLSPLDMRVSWQLGLALVSTGKVSYGQNGAEKADAASVAYAAQLTSAGEWLEAVFVLLHVSDPSARVKAIQDHLCRHAGLIGGESDVTFNVLVDKFRIPAAWIWEALALYMRGVKKDPSAEVSCLLRAGSFVEAHRVLVQQVAPLAIVERDYASLSSLISQFQGRQESVAEWPLGGEVYSLLLSLVQHRSKGESTPPAVLEKLLGGLHAMNENAPEAETVRFAAISDMADETAREILKLAKKKQDMELRSRILNLPLTQDRLLAYSVDLGLDRYREVMSH